MSDDRHRGFERRLIAHLNRSFPAECATLGGEGIRQAVRSGIALAATYGIRLERDICRYVDLMFVLGHDFDRDLPWASDILSDEMCPNPTAKVERLYAVAKARTAPALSAYL